VAEQSELLPERQVLQREIGMGPERCTRGAQESEYEGHCAPASLDANRSSSATIEFWQTTSRELIGMSQQPMKRVGSLPSVTARFRFKCALQALQAPRSMVRQWRSIT
jgi:hypothetical protein